MQDASFSAALLRDDPDELLRLPLALALDPPEEDRPGHAEWVCLILSGHPHPNVRGNAILGFGHLARTAGMIREEAAVRAAVEKGLSDPSDYVSGHADSAASDLAHVLGWTFPHLGPNRLRAGQRSN